MKLSFETVARIYAGGRNYINQIIGFAAGAGVITVAQDKGLMDALDEIAKGFGMVIHGASSVYAIGVVIVGPPIGWLLAWYAQRSAKNTNQVAQAVATANDLSNPVKAEAVKIALANAAILTGAEKVISPAIANNPATLPSVVAG